MNFSFTVKLATKLNIPVYPVSIDISFTVELTSTIQFLTLVELKTILSVEVGTVFVDQLAASLK